jgi:hypothetical protein
VAVYQARWCDPVPIIVSYVRLNALPSNNRCGSKSAVAGFLITELNPNEDQSDSKTLWEFAICGFSIRIYYSLNTCTSSLVKQSRGEIYPPLLKSPLRRRFVQPTIATDTICAID